MKATTQTFIFAITLLVALAAGFGLRRASLPEQAGEGQPWETSNPATRPASVAGPKLAEDLPDDPDALLKLAIERNEAGDTLGAAIAVYQFLKISDAQTLAVAIASAEDSLDSEIIWDTAVLRWAELDAAFLIAKYGEDAGHMLRWAILAADLRKDAAATLEAAPEEFIDHCRRYIAARHPEFDLDWARSFGVPLDWFVRIWLQRDLDPAGLLAKLGELEPEVSTAVLSHLFGGRDRAKIAAILKEIGDDPESLKLAHETIAKALSRDVHQPLESLKLLEEFGITYPPDDNGGPRIALYHYYQSALSETPESTIDWLLGLDPEKRAASIGNLFNSSYSGNTNFIGWLDLYRRLPSEELPSMIRMSIYLDQMIMQNPGATLDWFKEIVAKDHFSTGENSDENPQQFFSRAGKLGIQLALGGMDSAVATARKLEDPELRGAVMGGIIEYALTLDTAAARSILDESGDALSESDRKVAEFNIVRRETLNEFLNSPLADAIETLRAIGDEKTRAAIARFIPDDHTLPYATRAAALDEFPVSIVLNYPAAFTEGWARESPAEAADWILKHADHKKFPDHVKGVIDHWLEKDLNAAATWLSNLKPGPALDVAAASVVRKASWIEPHTALQWAASISDPELRAKSLQAAIIGIDTYATEVDEARGAIRELAISDEERVMLMEHLAK